MDLNKYLALKPSIDADVELGQQEVKDAEGSYLLAKTVYDDAVNRLTNLVTVQKMIDEALKSRGH